MIDSGDVPSRHVYALSELTESITRMFEKYYSSPYWIKAEISALNLYPSSGHCFPLMVEKSDGKVKAQLKATIWKEDLFNITQKFEEVTHEIFREGLNIMFLAYVRFSSNYGLTLQIIDIEPLFTLGQMAQDKMNTINDLKKEGIFNNNRLLQLPVLLKNIAVISVASSKGYNDLMVTLRNNKQGYSIISTLFPAILQGNGAVETITAQLRAIKLLKKNFDAVVIVRGGGDDVGLSCYDQPELARAVATFPLPVITGIGHSTNETVVEMVACVNKITPTDVAHFILAGFSDQDILLASMKQELINAIMQTIERENKSLTDFQSRISYNPAQLVNRKRVDLENSARMLLFNIQHFLTSQKQYLSEKEHRVRLLDPINVLKRGYAIVRIREHIPVDEKDVNAGDTMDIEMHKLKIKGIVEDIIGRES